MRHGDLIAGLVLLAFGLIAVFFVIPTQIVAAPAAGLSPRGMPTFTAGMICILSFLLVVKSVVTGARKGEEAFQITAPGFYRLVAGFATILASVLIFAVLGFLASGVFTIAALMLLMGERRLSLLTLIPLLSTASLYIFVVYGLHVTVP